jgi:hypothetical protein
MISDFDIDNEYEHSIPIWRIGISIFFLIMVLFVTSSLLCFTNNNCKITNLMEYSFVNGISSLLSLHLFVSFGIYCLTMEKAYIACRVQMVSAVISYISVVIAVFIFPFTNFEKLWAHLVMLIMFSFWKICSVWCLFKYYKYKSSVKRFLVYVQLAVWIIFNGFGIGYIFYRDLEYGCYGCMLLFLVISIVHICDIKIKIITR